VLVFAAVAPGDTEKDASALAAKVLKMKLWDDESGGRVFFLIYLYVGYVLILRFGSGNKVFRTLVVKFFVVRYANR